MKRTTKQIIKDFLQYDRCATHYKAWCSFNGQTRFIAAIGQETYGAVFEIQQDDSIIQV